MKYIKKKTCGVIFVDVNLLNQVVNHANIKARKSDACFFHGHSPEFSQLYSQHNDDRQEGGLVPTMSFIKKGVHDVSK